MSKYLFIVESPNKCKTLRSFLGKDYEVMATVGHIKQIPRKGLNINVKNDFKPTYEVMSDKKKIVKAIKSCAKGCEKIFLASDSDREGEAIAYDVYLELDKKSQKKCVRITFNAINKKAVFDALDNTRDIDMDQVHAQRARQILDRLVGYKISPILWFTVGSGTSAGRVQSIALKIVCDREKEIKAFKPTDFWYIDALLQGKNGEFWARAITKDKDNRYLKDELSAEDLKKLEKAIYNVKKIDKKEKSVRAYPPFDTSSMLQAATSVHGWSVKKGTMLAQKLYEQGLVTYIRTDSYNVAQEALDEVRTMIKTSTSSKYIPAKPNYYKKKSKASAQEAHECIRPTHCEDKGGTISDIDQQKLYRLIRSRFVASQMTPMMLDTVSVAVKADCDRILTAKGQTVKFDGWSKMYKYTSTKENELPELGDKEKLNLKDIKKTKHTTKPPPRYNEASLVRKMELEGIGRPSTYASIMESIKKRGYAEKVKGKSGLIATELGMKVFDYLDANFKDFFMNLGFTATMEDQLLEVAEGNKGYLKVIQGTYDILQSEIKKARANDKENPRKADVTTGEKCKKCKGFIVKRHGKFGDFFACDQYPKCKTTYIEKEDGKFALKVKTTFKKTGIVCPVCKKAKRDGELIERKNKRDGSIFYGCNKYPRCKHTESPDKKDELDDLGI